MEFKPIIAAPQKDGETCFHRDVSSTVPTFQIFSASIDGGSYLIPMTDPWCWYIYANMTGVYILMVKYGKCYHI